MNEYGIVFDCDGTLIDSEDQVVQSIQYALKKVKAQPRGHAEIKELFGPGADQILLELTLDKKKAELAFNYYLESQSELVYDMVVYEGIVELLSKLKNSGVLMGMVTGRHARDLEIVLNTHGLKDYFAVIITDDQLKDPKPSPEGIFLAARRLNLEPENIFYVGDARGDIELAQKAGARAIAALWDKRVVNEILWNERPYLMAKTPADIWTHLFRHKTPLEKATF